VNKALSVGTILLGSIWYTWIKHIESITPDLMEKYQRVPTDPKETPDLEGMEEGHGSSSTDRSS